MSGNDKLEGATLGWHVRETSYPFSTPWMTLRQDRVQIEGKGETTYTYMEAPPAAFIVPVTRAGQILLIRQYRYTVDAWCLEIPAGGSHDRPGVPLVEVAREELREEIGAVCGTIEHVGMFYASNSKSDQECHVFLARDAELREPQALETTELIEVCPTPASDAVTLARSGGIQEGQSALALLMCEGLLRQYGYCQ